MLVVPTHVAAELRVVDVQLQLPGVVEQPRDVERRVERLVDREGHRPADVGRVLRALRRVAGYGVKRRLDSRNIA